MTVPATTAARPGTEPEHRVALQNGWSLWRLAALRSSGLSVSWLDGFAVEPDDPEERCREAGAAAARAVVAQPAFVEAVTWQNPALVRNWFGRFAADVAAGGGARLSRRDQREALVAFLAQRYCAKNETIGFFGPVAWARFTDGEGLAVHGTGELRARSLYREQWAVDEVARALAERPELAEHVVARRHPACSFTGGVLRRPRRAPEPLSGGAAELAAVLDRPRPVRELPEHLRGALARLRADGAVLVDLPVPLGERPEEALRAHVTAIPDAGLRVALLAELDGLDRATAAVAAAAGDPQAVAAALDGLDTAFAAVTGHSGHRAKPEHDLGRRVVYEDCRRDLDATIGEDLLDDLRAPLALLLDTARWLVAETAVEVERDLAARVRSLRGPAGRPVALCDLVMAAGDVLGGLPGTAAERVRIDFGERWSELLATADGGRLATDRIAPLVHALFPAGPPGWRTAHQHSPDLMLRARPGGRPQWVLGELHLALNTLENRAFLTQADDRDELLAATAADFPDGRFVPLYPAGSAAVTSRTYPPPALDLPDRYRYWSWAADEGHPAGVPVLPGAGLLVDDDDDGGRLVVRPAEGGWRAPLLEVLGEFLTALVVNRFRLRAPAPHQPRLLLDDVVVARETWHVHLVDLPAADTDYRQHALRDRLGELGMPQRVFVRLPDEPKPWLVDRSAPLSLRNLARGLRRCDPGGTAVFTEMLPGPNELWLAGPDGPLTSELRIVAYDGLATAGPLVDTDWEEPA